MDCWCKKSVFVLYYGVGIPRTLPLRMHHCQQCCWRVFNTNYTRLIWGFPSWKLRFNQDFDPRNYHGSIWFKSWVIVLVVILNAKSAVHCTCQPQWGKRSRAISRWACTIESAWLFGNLAWFKLRPKHGTLRFESICWVYFLEQLAQQTVTINPWLLAINLKIHWKSTWSATILLLFLFWDDTVSSSFSVLYW